MSWINIFGALMKMLTDNELEFLNEVIKSLLNVLRQELMSTAAESPWNNQKSEKMVELIKEGMNKL